MDADVITYLQAIDNPVRTQDMITLVDMLSRVTGEDAKMWGTSIISFGMYHYKYDSGREGDAPKIGLSNRKQAIVIYGLHLADDDHENGKLLSELGKYKTGKGCLYISKLSDVNIPTLEHMIRRVCSSAL